MKYYLATVTLHDGEHEHCERALIKADDINAASETIEAQIKIDNDDDQQDSDHLHFSFGDGLVLTELEMINEISKKDADVLEKVGRMGYV